MCQGKPVQKKINLDRLEKSRIFQGLANQEVNEVLANATNYLRFIEFKRNDILFKAGDCLGDIVYLEQGQLILTSLEASGKFNILHDYSAPCLVELRVALSSKKTLPNDVVATKSGRAYCFPLSIIDSLQARTREKLMTCLTHQLCDALIRAENRIDIISEYTSARRIMKYFELLSTFQGATIRLPMSLSQLANFLRISHSSLFQALGDLQDNGSINFCGKVNGRASYKIKSNSVKT
jgi:CRP-like cAMP-binding protein